MTRTTSRRSRRSQGAIAAIRVTLDQLELRSLFTGEHDDSDCIVQINAKDGGVDAQDFSEMLLRMYERWCERRGFNISLNYVSEGRGGRDHVGRGDHHRAGTPTA